MTLNRKKFPAMFISKIRNVLSGCSKLQTNKTKLMPQSLVESLGLTIDSEFIRCKKLVTQILLSNPTLFVTLNVFRLDSSKIKVCSDHNRNYFKQSHTSSVT